MRKIFLTSGLVVCMACPAFADLGPNGRIMTGDPATESNNDATCQYPTLQGHSGTSTFTAKWGKNWYAITLNSNTGTTTATGGSTAAAPTPLYTMKGQSGVYQTRSNIGSDQNPDYQFSNWVAVDQTAVDVLTSDPTGITVNYQVYGNKPSTATTDFTTNASSTGGQRAFLGFFADASSSTPLIDSTGALTPTGASVASGLSADTSWVAHWGLVQPSVTQPVLPGYTFQGWATTENVVENETLVSTETLNSTEIGQNTQYYARWSAAAITIRYNCGAPISGSDSETTGPSTETTQINMDGNGTLAAGTICSLPGYTFNGWSCTANALVTNGDNQTNASGNFVSGAAVTMRSSSEVSCTAQWTQNEITLHWETNGGSLAAGDQSTFGSQNGTSCDYDGDIDLPQNPTRPGYEFQGWTVSNPNE